jgi:endonuclease/exonuclease/phosphatase (EEP) superfamily protein YafD
MKDNSVLRKQQADSILARYKKETRPVLIIGDINETGFGKVSSIFKKGGFESACGVGGYACAPTWPGPSYLLPPVFQIDQIWGRKVRFLGAETILKGKSDHYPVMAYFRLQN